jgi:hypothetical protein
MKVDMVKTTSRARLQGFVGYFEVMHQTGEYDWELSCGPYETYEAAEKARQGWFKKEEIPHMRVVQFCSPNVKNEGLDAPERNP